MDFLLTGGHISDYTPDIELLGQRKAEAIIADKGYDSDKIKEHVVAIPMQAKAVIPPRSNRKNSSRSMIKTCTSCVGKSNAASGKLKCFRRFATRYEKSKNMLQGSRRLGMLLDQSAAICRYDLG